METRTKTRLLYGLKILIKNPEMYISGFFYFAKLSEETKQLCYIQGLFEAKKLEYNIVKKIKLNNILEA